MSTSRHIKILLTIIAILIAVAAFIGYYESNKSNTTSSTDSTISKQGLSSSSMKMTSNMPITGLPTNLDIHGGSMDMDMPPSNVDRDSSKYTPATAVTAHGLKIAPPSPNMVGIYTRSYDNFRSGVNSKETTLTPAAVQQRGLRKLFSVSIHDDARGMEAQPLIVPKVTISDGTTHDLLVLATMANTIYGYDANDGTLLWVERFGNPIVGNRTIDGWGINAGWGILSTPVIDPDTNTLYCVTWSSSDGSPNNGLHTFHSVSLKTGTESAAPINLEAAYYDPGNGLPRQNFAGVQRKQRSSLLLTNVNGVKTVFIPFGTIQETSTNARGWVVAIDLKSDTIGAAWTATARYSGAGIWMAGQGPAADSQGYVYALTGNGSFDGVTDFSECFLKLKYAPPTSGQKGSITPVDWWSPWSDSGRAGGPVDGIRITKDIGGGWDDADLGSGGSTLLSDFNFVIGAGKDGILYTLRTNNMGKTHPADFLNAAANYAKLATPAQWFTYAAFKHDTQGKVIGYEDTMPQDPTKLNFTYGNQTHHEHSTPVVIKEGNVYYLYCMGENGNVRAWSMDNTGKISFLANSAETASSNVPTGMPGGMLAMSSNGQSNAILYVTVPDGDANKSVTTGHLSIYDAVNFDKYSDGNGALRLLWKSPNYTYNKFDVPVVSGGKVYVPTYNGMVDVYGLN